MSESSENFYIDIDYAGRFGSLFGLSLKTLFLTVITLGIYRFWMKARMRRYYWSAIQPGGAPLEYTGTGLEKLLGFLIAVVILAIYLGIFNLALSFVGLAFFQGNPAALNLSFLAVIPLIFFAQYRARRYILSRTIWRGLRFGADNGAWKYMLRAIGHTLLSVVTLGLLVPRQNFYLEKFVTDRTWYGDLRFQQHGNWKMLLRPWLLVYGVIILVIALAVFGIQTQNELFAAVVPLGLLAIFLALAHYSVAKFRLLAAHKVAGDNIRFESAIRTSKVVSIYVLGSIAMAVASIILFAALFAVVGMFGGLSFANFSPEMLEDGVPPFFAAFVIIAVLGYFLFLLVMGALYQVFFIQPVLRHFAEETMVNNAEEIDRAGQRPFDKNVEAGGFADALDVGAAI